MNVKKKGAAPLYLTKIILAVLTVILMSWVILGPGKDYALALLNQFTISETANQKALREGMLCAALRCIHGCVTGSIDNNGKKIFTPNHELQNLMKDNTNGNCYQQYCANVPDFFKEDWDASDYSQRICGHNAQQYPIKVPAQDVQIKLDQLNNNLDSYIQGSIPPGLIKFSCLVTDDTTFYMVSPIGSFFSKWADKYNFVHISNDLLQDDVREDNPKCGAGFLTAGASAVGGTLTTKNSIASTGVTATGSVVKGNVYIIGSEDDLPEFYVPSGRSSTSGPSFWTTSVNASTSYIIINQPDKEQIVELDDNKGGTDGFNGYNKWYRIRVEVKLADGKTELDTDYWLSTTKGTQYQLNYEVMNLTSCPDPSNTNTCHDLNSFPNNNCNTMLDLNSNPECYLDNYVGLRIRFIGYNGNKNKVGLMWANHKGGLACDLNNDCKVDLTDIQTIQSLYGVKKGDPNYNPSADANNDGAINLSDFVICAQELGNTC